MSTTKMHKAFNRDINKSPLYIQKIIKTHSISNRNYFPNMKKQNKANKKSIKVSKREAIVKLKPQTKTSETQKVQFDFHGMHFLINQTDNKQNNNTSKLNCSTIQRIFQNRTKVTVMQT